MSRPIVLFTDEPGWHGARLRQALARRGYESRYLSLRQCGFDLQSPMHGLRLPGFDALPAGAFVRGVPGGSLEQIVHYLDILHALRRLGVPVYNSGAAIERSVDKGMTSFLLHSQGLPTPPTWVGDADGAGWRQALTALEAGHELVLKPLFGSQGKGLMRISRTADLPPPDRVSGLYYLQKFVRSGARGGHDWRVFVIGGRAVAAMRRSGSGWIHNLARGARTQAALLDPELRRLAEQASQALQMDYAGVDLMRDTEGRAWLIEVNGVPAWRGLQRVAGLDITALLASDFLRRCETVDAVEVAG